jgi:hypothetical protein
MTNDLKRLVPAQEKLEWVTPKISLMEAGDSESGQIPDFAETNFEDYTHAPS